MTAPPRVRRCPRTPFVGPEDGPRKRLAASPSAWRSATSAVSVEADPPPPRFPCALLFPQSPVLVHLRAKHGRRRHLRRCELRLRVRGAALLPPAERPRALPRVRRAWRPAGVGASGHAWDGAQSVVRARCWQMMCMIVVFTAVRPAPVHVGSTRTPRRAAAAASALLPACSPSNVQRTGSRRRLSGCARIWSRSSSRAPSC